MLMQARTLRALLVLGIAAVTASAAHAQDPARTDGWVVLALDDYRALRARAFPSTPDPLPPPVDATLTRVDYDLRVNGDTVTGEARLTIDVLKQGWVSIQMPAGMLVRGARLDGRPTALVDGTPPRVLVSRSGRAVITLEIVVPLASSGGLESMTLPPSASALSAVTLTVPRTGVDLTVSGGFVAEQTESATENRWTVYGAPGRPLAFSWKRKIDDRRSTLPLRTRARITELVALGEETSQITASVRIEVVQGLARDVVLSTPEGVTVNQVTGATVADWSHAPGSLTVSFLEPLTTSTSLVVSAETRAPRDGVVAIPIVRMPAAERETGGVAVDVVGAGEITDRQPRGFDPADPSDLGDIVAGRESPSMVAFGFTPLAGAAAARADGHGLAVHAEGGARRQRGGSALRRPRRRRRQAPRPRALRGPEQPARPSSRSRSRRSRSSGARCWPAGPSAPACLPRAPTCCRCRRDARARTRRRLPSSSCTCSARPRGTSRVMPASSCPRSIFQCRAPASWCTTRRASRSSPSPVPSGPKPIPVRGVPRCGGDDGHQRGNAGTAAASARARREAGGDSASLGGLVERFRKDMGKTTAGVVPVRVPLPDIGPSFFVAAELTAESQAPALDLDLQTDRSDSEDTDMTNNLRCLAARAVLLGLTLSAPLIASAQDRGPAGTVTLSRTDYDRLLDLAAGSRARPMARRCPRR